MSTELSEVTLPHLLCGDVANLLTLCSAHTFRYRQIITYNAIMHNPLCIFTTAQGVVFSYCKIEHAAYHDCCLSAGRTAVRQKHAAVSALDYAQRTYGVYLVFHAPGHIARIGEA